MWRYMVSDTKREVSTHTAMPISSLLYVINKWCTSKIEILGKKAKRNAIHIEIVSNCKGGGLFTSDKISNGYYIDEDTF